MPQGTLETSEHCDADDADVPMTGSESDSEDFEDVLAQDLVVDNDARAIHDLSIQINTESSMPHGPSYGDSALASAQPSFARSVRNMTHLPRPRTHPLPRGGPKEASLIFYLDRALDRVGRRATNRRVKDLLPGELSGYTSFAQAVEDLDSLVDVVWVSGTPTLQLPYLITITVSTINYLPMFPALPRTTLGFLDKLDIAFATLLGGYDPETRDTLPDLSGSRKISTTDKVRVKGVVERARSTVTKHLVTDEGFAAPVTDNKADGANETNGGFVKFEGFDEDDNSTDGDITSGFNHQDVAHVFERTIMELGELLGGDAIGLVTDEEQDMRRQFGEEAAALREQEAIKKWDTEQDAMEEQRQYIENGKAEFKNEARWLEEG